VVDDPACRAAEEVLSNCRKSVIDFHFLCPRKETHKKGWFEKGRGAKNNEV